MRKTLDFLYDSAAALAALFMVGLLVMVLLSIIGRQLHFNLPGIDAYAGYLMAGTGFLALAHTLKRGEHIRVTLIVSRLGPAGRRWLERWACGAAAMLAALFAFYSVRLAWQSRIIRRLKAAGSMMAERCCADWRWKCCFWPARQSLRRGRRSLTGSLAL